MATYPTAVNSWPLSINFWPAVLTNPVDAGGAGAEVLELITDVEDIVDVGLLETELDWAGDDAVAPGMH